MLDVNDLVTEIGTLLSDGLIPPWQRVVLEMSVSDESFDIEAWYEATGRENESVSLFGNDRLVDPLSDALEEMWDRFNAAGSPWRKLVFTLSNDGEANVKLEYDD